MAKGDSMTIPWKAFQNEALDCLRALIRLDTTNPPGNERIAADYIADALAAHGVESVIRESAPTRASLIAALAGLGADLKQVFSAPHVAFNRAIHQLLEGQLRPRCSLRSSAFAVCGGSILELADDVDDKVAFTTFGGATFAITRNALFELKFLGRITHCLDFLRNR